MSQENVEVVQRAFERFREEGDFSDDFFTDDFVWDMSTFRGWPEEQTYEGIDGARRFMATWLSAFEDWSVEVESLHDGGDEVVAIVRQRGRSKATDLPVDMTFAQVFTIRDGRQARMRMYADPAEGLEATGLSEGTG